MTALADMLKDVDAGVRYAATDALGKMGMSAFDVLTTVALKHGDSMNNGSVIMRKSTQSKLPFLSAHVFPRFSILDPTKTFTLPPSQIANKTRASQKGVAPIHRKAPKDNEDPLFDLCGGRRFEHRCLGHDQQAARAQGAIGHG